MEYSDVINRMKQNINHVFVGKEEVVEKILICLLAGGYVLIEDVPGVGKTTLASVLARTIRCSFGRIQFTPDTLPGSADGPLSDAFVGGLPGPAAGNQDGCAVFIRSHQGFSGAGL